MSQIQGVTRKGEPKPERLYSVGELAAMFRASHRTMRRRLLSLHRQHDGGWLMCMGRRKLLVNLSLFRAHHPHVFAVDVVTRDEIEDLQERVDDLEQSHRTEKQRLNGAFARVRRVEQVAKNGTGSDRMGQG